MDKLNKDIWDTNMGRFVKMKVKQINDEALAASFMEYAANSKMRKRSVRMEYELERFYQKLASKDKDGFSSIIRSALWAVKRAIEAGNLKLDVD